MRSSGHSGLQGGTAVGAQDQEPKRHPGAGPGKLYIIGLGPGGPEGLTFRARRALEESRVVVGYSTYLKLAEPFLEGKEIISGRMTKELDRAGQALDAALAGKVTALISSGDPGIYAMAPVVFELARTRGLDLGGENGLAVEVIPGVPAVAAAASLLGAPLSHDFCCISLSDRLTPWELIEKRLSLAARADFVIALYNPKSKSRDWQLERASSILLEHKDPATPAGVVTRAMREGQSVSLTTLEGLPKAPVDMQTIVIIGNSQSFTLGDRLVTPRGYIKKYGG